MDAKTQSDRQTPETRKVDEPHPHANGKPVSAETQAVARLEEAVLKLGTQQMEIVKALNVLATRLPPPNAGVAQDPLVELVRQVQENPKEGKHYMALGNRLLFLKQYDKAEAAFRAASELMWASPIAHSSVAAALIAQKRFDEALVAYRAAMAIDPFCPARGKYSELLHELKRPEAAVEFWSKELQAAPHDYGAARSLVYALLHADRLQDAAEVARKAAEIGWSTRLWPVVQKEHPTLARDRLQWVKAPKLRHDIEQLEYLVSQGIKADELPPIIAGLKKVLARVAPLGDQNHAQLTQDERIEVGGYYNRILHMRDTPRVEKALSYAWDMKAIEDDYLANPPGIIHIDNLLTQEALHSLWRFCVESTVFNNTNHENGYLGAYIPEGFCPPLLVQIAEELRAAMPRVIGKHRVVGMWAYKYDQTMAGIKNHADMAAVNVNFWLTPDECNLDPTQGGLIVYDAEAPMEWDFETFNGNTDKAQEMIHELTTAPGVREVKVPYKRNRAVIFNSDLFHRTAPLNFKPGYENRRINVTILYGDRSDGRTPPATDKTEE